MGRPPNGGDTTRSFPTRGCRNQAAPRNPRADSLSARCSRVAWPRLPREAIDQRNHMARSLCMGVWRANRSLRPRRRLAGWPIGLNLDSVTRPVELYLEPDTVDWMRYPYWGGGLPERGVVAALVSSQDSRRCCDPLLRLCACFPCSEHDLKPSRWRRLCASWSGAV